MLHAGVGETHLNDILTSLDVPAVCHKTVKKVERTVGKAMESCAARSCQATLALECRLTQEKSTSSDSASNVSPSSGVLSPVT